MDVTCSGATVAAMSNVQSTDLGVNGPQLSAVAPDDRVVTLGIGGNDIDFRGIVENCMAATPWGPTRVGKTCKSYYDPGGRDHIAAKIQALQARISATVDEIRARAPGAKILVVGYPAILPPAGFGCWPQLPLTSTDVPYLRLKELQLNGMLAAVAKANDVTFVDTYGPSEPHNACTAEPVRWIEPIVPDALAFPVHPNAAGEAGMAKLVEAAVGLPVSRLGPGRPG
jgi:hypothetical protein